MHTYDIGTKEWKSLGEAPSSMIDLAMATDGNKIFACGFGDAPRRNRCSSNTMNGTGSTWTSLPAMPRDKFYSSKNLGRS